MLLSSEIRHNQGGVFRTRVLRGRWTFRRLAEATGIPRVMLRQYASGHTVLSVYAISRIAHICDLSDRAVRDLVDGTALRSWHADPRGRPQPFDPPVSS